MLRVALFAATLLAIRQHHVAYRAQQTWARSAVVDQQQLQQFFPGTPHAGALDLTHGAQSVIGASGDTLGFVVQTSPASEHVIGYLGPTNVLIAFDSQYRVIGIEVLDSGDTPEHVTKVIQDRRFMNTYRGLSWQESARRHNVDAVSGATLTSLAIVESISLRLGDPCPSLRFPDELRLREVKSFLPNAVALRERSRQPLMRNVIDVAGQRIGAVLRTSPTCDGLAGYQGPTDTLIVFDARDRVVGIAVRSSYDNQPYVRYVQQDEYFRNLFNGLQLAELADLDLEAMEVEGVSGATITSMAVARSLLPAATVALKRPEGATTRRFSVRDVATCLLVASALLMTFTHLRGRRRLRWLCRVVLVVYLGFLSGDMLSQALLVGWARSGVPWRLAPSLVLLVAAALLVPILSKRQMYCHHLCPFGAAQQMLRGRWLLRSGAPRYTVPRSLQRVLRLVTPTLLLLVVVTAVRHLPLNLAGIEPFNAFCFWIAGAATLVVAAIGLVGSVVVPMAYCRYGCPTGAILAYLRFDARSDRLSRRDLLAAALLVLALVL